MPLDTHTHERRGDRHDRMADWGFGVSLVLGAQYATVESLTHMGVHFSKCGVSHAESFPWMTLASMMIFAAPKTIGPERVARIVLGAFERVKNVSGLQKALPKDGSKPDA